jgi:hypothetical protein
VYRYSRLVGEREGERAAPLPSDCFLVETRETQGVELHGEPGSRQCTVCPAHVVTPVHQSLALCTLRASASASGSGLSTARLRAFPTRSNGAQ